jgi:dCMP deaminase
VTDWDKRFMDLAWHVSTWSKDRSTKVGAVITLDRTLLSIGFNGMPRKVNDDRNERHERPIKYMWMEHAERNAIFNSHCSLAGATIHSTLYPCADCARAIIQTGITRVVAPEPELARWDSSHKIATVMFSEAGIKVNHV